MKDGIVIDGREFLVGQTFEHQLGSGPRDLIRVDVKRAYVKSAPKGSRVVLLVPKPAPKEDPKQGKLVEQNASTDKKP